VSTRDAHRLARALQAVGGERPAVPAPVPDAVALLDALVTEPDLRRVVRQVFVNGHYALAVEEGFKYLNNLVKRRSGLQSDGASLMSTAFSLNTPILKLSDLRTQSKKDQQLGYMQILQGSMTGIRNPRAHEHRYLDEPRNALELLALCNHLVRVVTAATRARRRPVS
jgi:uncharacterized protein (TIGR02391 family)